MKALIFSLLLFAHLSMGAGKCRKGKIAYDCRKIELSKRKGFCSKDKKLSKEQISLRCQKEKTKKKN